MKKARESQIEDTSGEKEVENSDQAENGEKEAPANGLITPLRTARLSQPQKDLKSPAVSSGLPYVAFLGTWTCKTKLLDKIRATQCPRRISKKHKTTP